METIKVLDREFVPYIDHETIVSKIKEMAEKMNRDLRDKNPLFLGVLNGVFMFAGDLMKDSISPAKFPSSNALPMPG